MFAFITPKPEPTPAEIEQAEREANRKLAELRAAHEQALAADLAAERAAKVK